MARSRRLDKHGKGRGNGRKGVGAILRLRGGAADDEIGAKSASFGVRVGLSEPTNTPLASGVAGRRTRGQVRRKPERTSRSVQEAEQEQPKVEHLVEQAPW